MIAVALIALASGFYLLVLALVHGRYALALGIACQVATALRAIVS